MTDFNEQSAEFLNQLHTNQRLLVIELQKRGAIITEYEPHDELLQVSYDGKTQFLLDRFSASAPYHMVTVSADKHLAKRIMRDNGISVPAGEVFTGNSMEAALLYAQDKYPLVLKPNWGSHGNYVQVDIRNPQSLELAIWQFVALLGKEEAFILEAFYPWPEYRLFITSQDGFAVVKRDPAMVIGNGQNTISQLAQIETNKREAQKKAGYSSLCPLVMDAEVDKYLNKQGLDSSYIPNDQEKIYLRHQSNLAKGGMAIDMTDQVHPSIKECAITALKAFPGLPCLGLDLLCPNVTAPLTDYVIIEANSNPGLAMHMFPSIGTPRNVAALMADIMFPDL